MTEREHMARRWQWQFSNEKPKDEEGFLTLSIITPDGAKQFVVTTTAKELLNRERKSLDYLTIDAKRQEIRVTLEWVSRDAVRPEVDLYQ